MKDRSIDGWRSPHIGVALALTLGVALFGCSNGLTSSGALVPGTVVDRYTIGDPVDCPVETDARCADVLGIATDTATTKRAIAPPTIVGHRVYSEDSRLRPPGAVSGGGVLRIVVFDIADGSRVAIGVFCGVGPCQVVPR